MDKARKEKLRDALRLLESVERIVGAVCEKEEDCVDNYPENLQGTERYECMEEAADRLNEALESLSEARSSIEAAIQ